MLLWAGEIHEHHVRPVLHSFEDNLAAISGDVKLSNVKACSEISQLPLGATLQVNEPEILMQHLSSQKHELLPSGQKG